MTEPASAPPQRDPLAVRVAPWLAAPVLVAYYWALWWAFFATRRLSQFTGANNEPGPRYGLWSGFGGTILFSAMVLVPPWYYARTCHHAIWCLWPGKHAAAGGTFMLCRFHHPDLRGQRPHGALIHRLHMEWKHGSPQ